MLENVDLRHAGYLERHGTPMDIASLAGHRGWWYAGSLTAGTVTPLNSAWGENAGGDLALHAVGHGETESYLAGIRLGAGLAQVPRFSCAGRRGRAG